MNKLTVRDIAAMAGVSAATVSLVLNNKKGVGDETRQRIVDIITEHEYTKTKKNSTQLPLRILFVKYSTHGMAVEENQGFIASTIDCIERICRTYSYKFMLINCTAETLYEVVRDIKEDDTCDAVIFLGTELQQDYYPILKSIKKPLVVLDNSMEFQNSDSVVMDNQGIAYIATRYLYNLGHRRIGYLRSNIDVPNLNERYDGYLKCLKSLDLEAPAPVLLRPTLNGAYEDMKNYLVKNKSIPQTAFFAENDSVAIGVSRALQEFNYKVPQDISVMGVDDIPFSSIAMPSITTMRVSRTALGTLTIDLIQRRLKTPNMPPVRMQVLGTLVERDSTSPLIK